MPQIVQGSDDLTKVAEALGAGEVVIFPTETVYGIGANALDAKAVESVYQIKGRPSDNPMIVHLASVEQLEQVVDEITPLASKLFGALTPGPLTLIMKRSEQIPDKVTAGLETVGIRIPANPIAHKLLELAQIPVAAPSANLSGKPSATNLHDAIEDFASDDRVSYIIGGEPSTVGIESTVLDITVDPPVILRPGAVTAKQISEVIGQEVAEYHSAKSGVVQPKAPGMKYRHYAPKAKVIVMPRNQLLNEFAIESFLANLPTELNKKIVGLIVDSEVATKLSKKFLTASKTEIVINSYASIESAMHQLFASFRNLDRAGCGVIIAQAESGSELAAAYMNRLLKAESKK